MSWIFYALTAPFLYGISNLIDRFLIEKRIRDTLFITALGGFVTLFFGFAIFILRGFPIFAYQQILILAIAGVCAELALLPYYRSISIDDPSRIIPLFQSIPAVTLILSYFILGEKLNENQMIGFVLTISGGLFLSFEKSTQKKFQLRKSFGYVTLAVLLYSFSAILFKFVVINRNFWDTISYEFLGGGIGAFILLKYLKSNFFEEIKKIQSGTWTIISANEIIYLFARLSWFYAIALAPVALVSVLGGIQPFIVFIAGLIFSIFLPHIIKEDLSKTTVTLKIIAIILIFIGILFINH